MTTMTAVLPSEHFPEMVHDLVAVTPVQLPGRFVRQDDLRLVDQGPGHRHPLAFASGKAVGGMVEPVSQFTFSRAATIRAGRSFRSTPA